MTPLEIDRSLAEADDRLRSAANRIREGRRVVGAFTAATVEDMRIQRAGFERIMEGGEDLIAAGALLRRTAVARMAALDNAIAAAEGTAP